MLLSIFGGPRGTNLFINKFLTLVRQTRLQITKNNAFALFSLRNLPTLGSNPFDHYKKIPSS